MSYRPNYTFEIAELWTNSGKYDVRRNVQSLNIFEDIYTPFLTGYVDMIDTENYMEIGPIYGEEYFYFKITITGMHGQADRTIERYMSVYKVENEQTERMRVNTYRLWLISDYFKNNANTRSRKYYEGTQDEIVSTIVNNQMKGTMIRSDKCEIAENYIMPNWHPVACIRALSKNSRSAGYGGDPDYVFYEDLEGFHYVSMGYMMDEKNGLVLPWNPNSRYFQYKVITEQNRIEEDFNLEDYHKKLSFDIVDNVNKGMYGVTMINNNLTKRKWREDTWNYQDNFPTVNHVSFAPLSTKGADWVKNRFQYIPTNSEGSPGSYQEDIVPEDRRKLSIRQMETEQNRFVLEIHGDPGRKGFEMKTGRPLFFDLKSLKKDIYEMQDDHEYLHGKFLIHIIRHSFSLDDYKQFVEITKDSFEKGV